MRRLYALTEMHQQEVNGLEVAAQVIRDGIENHIQLLDKRIEQLPQAIHPHIADDPDLPSRKELLLSIPGIGKKTEVDAVTSLCALPTSQSTLSRSAVAEKATDFYRLVTLIL